MVRTLAQGLLIAGITPITLANSTALSADYKKQLVSEAPAKIDSHLVDFYCATSALPHNCLASTTTIGKLEIDSYLWQQKIAKSFQSNSSFLTCGEGPLQRLPTRSGAVHKLWQTEDNETIQSNNLVATFDLVNFTKIGSALSSLGKPVKQKCIFSWQKQLDRKLIDLNSIKLSKSTADNDRSLNDYSQPKASQFPQLSRSSLIVSFPQENSSFVPINSKLANPAPETKRIASPFGWRNRPYSNQRQFHQGIDYGAPYGSPVVAVGNGIVTRIVSGCADFGNLFCGGQLGNWIEVDHGNGRIGTYGHLKRSSITVKEGMRVRKNQNIAQVGSSGWSTGAHLDFRLKIDGKHQDPAKYVMAIEPRKNRVVNID